MLKLLGWEKIKLQYTGPTKIQEQGIIPHDAPSVFVDSVQDTPSVSTIYFLLIMCTRITLAHYPNTWITPLQYTMSDYSPIKHIFVRSMADIFGIVSFKYMMGGYDIPYSVVNPPYNRFLWLYSNAESFFNSIIYTNSNNNQVLNLFNNNFKHNGNGRPFCFDYLHSKNPNILCPKYNSNNYYYYPSGTAPDAYKILFITSIAYYTAWGVYYILNDYLF